MTTDWTIEKLLEEVRFSRVVHKEWADWETANPDALARLRQSRWPMVSYIGDPEFHRNQVAKYDAIERLLTGIQSDEVAGGGDGLRGLGDE